MTSKQKVVLAKIARLQLTHIDEIRGTAKFPDGETVNGNMIYALTKAGILSTEYLPGSSEGSYRRRHVLTTADTPKRNFKITCKTWDNTEEHTVLIDAYNSTQALDEALDLVPYARYRNHRVEEVR